ncbi:hypothetical protein C8Q76DRAFT_795080 [Earliella scabrosa]|nr:hypothetical protein C8Q76DRAFT_795080 [Earliella scabrosa]
MASASSSAPQTSNPNPPPTKPSTTKRSSTRSSSKKGDIKICVSGYVLTKEMVKHLCLLQYGATQADIDHFGALDFAAYHYEQLKPLEAPYLIPMTFHDRLDPSREIKLWLLPGKVAFVKRGRALPNLPLDGETKAYLNAWFPSKLLKRPEFRGLHYIQTVWPRDQAPRNIIMTKLINFVSEAKRKDFEQMQKDWLAWMEKRGEPVLEIPPPFPASWHFD